MAEPWSQRLLPLALALVKPVRGAALERLLAISIEHLPGVRAGSIIVRQPDGLFGFAATQGYDLAALSRLRFDLSSLRAPESVLLGKRILEETLDPPTRALLEPHSAIGPSLSVPVGVAGELFGFVQLEPFDPLVFGDPTALELFGAALRQLFDGLVERALERGSWDRSAPPHQGDLSPLAPTESAADRALHRVLLTERIAETLRSDAGSGRATLVMMVHLDRFVTSAPPQPPALVDEVREAVARRLTRRVGQSGTITHMGGNLLAVVEGGLANAATAHNLTRSIAEALSLPFSIGGVPWQVETSVGDAVGPVDGGDPLSLLTHAELVMMGSERTKGATATIPATQQGSGEADGSRLVDDLRLAISRGEGFTVALQPIVRLSDGLCLGFEALARWSHPQHGEVSPRTFGPLSEDHGLIHLLSARVFSEAARAFADLRQQATAASIEGHREWFLSVNVSPLEIMHGDVVSLAQATLQRHGLFSSDLEIEITESAALEGRPELRRTLDRLRAEGIAVAIDDFGTGYASLQRLARVNADTVKIDPSFVGAAVHDAREAAIIDAILALAKSLGSRVIAEGIEHPAQLELLRQKGCELGQGFLFLPPRPVDEVVRWLRAGGAQKHFSAT